VWKHRKRFTVGFLAGHALRAVVRSGVLDAIARAYDNPTVRRGVVRTLGSALAGSSVHEAPVPGAHETRRGANGASGANGSNGAARVARSL
jgi:hypothetical protein